MEWDATGIVAGGWAAAEPPAVHTAARNTEVLVPNAEKPREHAARLRGFIIYFINRVTAHLLAEGTDRALVPGV